MTASPSPTLAPGLPPEMEALRRTLRDFADREVRPRIEEMERAERLPDDLVDHMGTLGFFGAPFPEEYGGAGMGELGFAIVQEELSKAHASTGLIVAASSGLAARLLHQSASEEQKHRYLVPMAQGRTVGAFCLTEPQAGSDVPALAMRATRDGDEYVLNGEKAFITNGDRAGVFMTFAVTDPDRGRDGLSLFIVEGPSPGLSVLRVEEKMGLLPSGTAHLAYDEVRVPAANLVGEEGQGFRQALATLNASRIGIGAMSLGIAREALDLAWEYAHTRPMFGGTEADFQVTQHAFADMEIEVYAVESILYRTAMMADAGVNYESEASVCKVLATEAAQRIVDRSLQMHGGVGYLRGTPIERLYRDIRVARIYEGANEVQRNNIYRVMRRRRGVPA